MTSVAGTDWAVWVPAITLDELIARAALQTRTDRKYVLDADQVDLATQLPGDIRVLTVAGETAVRYESVYFDTLDLRCFRDAAHGHRRRFKVRTRSYPGSGVCFLEVKTVSGRGQTVKRREPHPYADRATVTPRGRAFVAEVLGRDDLLLRPALLTRYERTTLVDLAGGWRLTLDMSLRFTAPDGRSVGMPGRVVVETKAAGAATEADRLLWRSGVRPTRISKYGVGLAALDPSLPANRWSRTLRRHLDDAERV
jgi:hypothetical protein